MPDLVLLGNIITFAGAVVMVLIGFIKTKKNILRMQCVQCAIMGVGNLVLGGVTGFTSNMVTIVRNIVSFRTPLTVPLKLFFIALQAALGLGFNQLGLVGWLPVIASSLFTWFMDTESEVTLKIVIILMQVLWAVFDLNIRNYIALVMDLFTIGSNLVGIWMLLRMRSGQERD